MNQVKAALLLFSTLLITACVSQVNTPPPETQIPATPSATSTPNLTATVSAQSTDFAIDHDNYYQAKYPEEFAIAKRFGLQVDYLAGSKDLSPDKQWLFHQSARLDMKQRRDIFTALFTKTDKSQEWSFEETPTSIEMDICHGGFEVDFWSPDGKFAYFSFAGGWCSATFNYSEYESRTPVVYRLNLETSEFVEYLPITGKPKPDNKRYTYSFSPDGTLLTYFQIYTSPLIVRIKNLETERETRFTLNGKYREAGCLAWIGVRQFMFYASTTTHPGDEPNASLYLVDVERNSIKRVISDQHKIYCVHDSRILFGNWIPPSRDFVFLRIPDIRYESIVEEWYFNPNNLEMILVPTVTPYPSSKP